MSLVAELKRRRVFRALVGYGIAAFAVLQIVEPVMHGLRWPDAVLGYVVVVLALGFPVVVALAWIFDVKGSGGVALSKARVALVLAAIGVLSGAPGVAWYFLLHKPPAAVDRSIAVLPFASLSGERDAAYFADGFHDELLRQMARLGNLQVISRTSVLQYKEGARNLREIGAALGVASIVEGSVQRAGNRMRVEAKLVDARSDRQLWAELYDRDLTDVFAIQSAVAQEIANALDAKLSRRQKEQLDKQPTQDREAYDLYLRAVDYDYEHRPDMHPRDLEISEGLYRRAIARDPSFALARARLATSLLSRFWFVAGTPTSVTDDARRQAEEAVRLDPELPQAHLSMGYFHYWGERQYEPALREFEMARSGAPAEALDAIAAVERRQGRFIDAVTHLEETIQLNPRSTLPFITLGETLQCLRRYADAERAYQSALRIAPDSDAVLARLAFLYEQWRGDATAAKKLLPDAARRLDPQGRFANATWVTILGWHNPREALAVLDVVRADPIPGARAIYPRALLLAMAHEALGQAAQARREYQAALARLESEVRAYPKNASQRSLLALAYASLGRRDDALRESQRAVDDLPLSKDALYGFWPLMEQGLIAARFGDADRAIAIIRQLLAVPAYLSPGLLRVDPRWAPLYSDPRFRKLAEMDNAEALRIPAPASR